MRFSQLFQLNKNQAELDFVDIVLNKDIPLFIDPYAISQRRDFWSIECHHLIVDFFQKAVDAIRENRNEFAKTILSCLHEPNETRLGLSIGKPKGRGIGTEQSTDLYRRLCESNAVKTGFLKDLEDCELIIPGIDRDKISDITTNIIKSKLAEYTKEQCDLLGIQTQRVVVGPFWNQHTNRWENNYTELPVYNQRKILLVPKAIVRYDLEYDYKEYYNYFVLNFLETEEIKAGTALVRTLKSGVKRIYKKDLKKKYPLSKEFLYQFSRDNPEVLKNYKGSKEIGLRDLSNEDIELTNPEKLELSFEKIKEKLFNTPTGLSNASDYHKIIYGILESIFYPRLIYPKKEEEIHEGRKRIDIVFSNADKEGFFYRLGKFIPCPFIMIEGKNYSEDPRNPELDQIAGRFSPNRGTFGIIVCRKILDKEQFYKRCRDTAQDDRGIIIGLDDDDLIQLIKYKSEKHNWKIDEFLDGLYRRVVM